MRSQGRGAEGPPGRARHGWGWGRGGGGWKASPVLRNSRKGRSSHPCASPFLPSARSPAQPSPVQPSPAPPSPAQPRPRRERGGGGGEDERRQQQQRRSGEGAAHAPSWPPPSRGGGKEGWEGNEQRSSGRLLAESLAGMQMRGGRRANGERGRRCYAKWRNGGGRNGAGARAPGAGGKAGGGEEPGAPPAAAAAQFPRSAAGPSCCQGTG